ncbi:MAG: glycosyltransferase [Candidatus Nitrohelix vancouverensis]|uniref:Glycosyltransferase n=1 Tax=Candidatus Nitrohelix vancouverensis TaxID=2705534 RepID=A0A7T0C2I1_9BACT|nr:MAG: glycosyltransferase [Candidatus Nitrohelix vancouverensis]
MNSDQHPSPALPTLTVVVPSFNQGETIEQTLISICDHNAMDGVEVLVFDACSTDGTERVLDAWKSRCTVIQEKDRGQSDAINKGFKRASGDIVCWLNTDDMFFPGALDRVRTLFAENPEAGVISGRGVHLKKDGSFDILFPEGPDLSERNIQSMRIDLLQPAVFFRRSSLEQIGGINPDLQYLMDLDLWMRFVKAGVKWKLVDDFFSSARVYPETKTSSGGWTRLREHMKLTRRHTGSMFSRTTLSLLMTWGMASPYPRLQKLFEILYRVYTLMRSGSVRPPRHQPLECLGETRVSFPWYQGSCDSIRVCLERLDGTAGAAKVRILCDGVEWEGPFHAGENEIELRGDFASPLFSVSVETSPPVVFKLLNVIPGRKF